MPSLVRTLPTTGTAHPIISRRKPTRGPTKARHRATQHHDHSHRVQLQLIPALIGIRKAHMQEVDWVCTLPTSTRRSERTILEYLNPQSTSSEHNTLVSVARHPAADTLALATKSWPFIIAEQTAHAERLPGRLTQETQSFQMIMTTVSLCFALDRRTMSAPTCTTTLVMSQNYTITRPDEQHKGPKCLTQVAGSFWLLLYYLHVHGFGNLS